MSPEAVEGKGGYDCDCDIYSYGVVCWELWTQCLPFASLTPELYQHWVCQRGYRPPDYYSRHDCRCECMSSSSSTTTTRTPHHQHRHQQQQQENIAMNTTTAMSTNTSLSSSSSTSSSSASSYYCTCSNSIKIPTDVSALLAQTWKHNPSSRIRWTEIQNQFQLFKQLEELQLEESALLLFYHTHHKTKHQNQYQYQHTTTTTTTNR